MSLTNAPNVVPPKNHGDANRFDNLRSQFEGVPGVFAFVLLSSDGLPLAGYGLSKEDVEKVSAACSGLGSLGRGVSDPVGGGEVHHQIMSMKQATFILTACGEGSIIGVYVHVDAETNVAIRETVRLARSFAPQMATDARADAQP